MNVWAYSLSKSSKLIVGNKMPSYSSGPTYLPTHWYNIWAEYKPNVSLVIRRLNGD